MSIEGGFSSPGTETRNKKGFIERNLNKFRAVAAGLSLMAAGESKALDTSQENSEERINSVMTLARAEFKKSDEDNKRAAERRNRENTLLNEKKKIIVGRIGEKYPGLMNKADSSLTKMLYEDNHQSLDYRMKLLEEAEIKIMEWAARNIDKKEEQKEGFRENVIKINKSFEDGWSAKFIIKKENNGWTIISEGSPTLFTHDQWLAKGGHNWGNLSFSERTLASFDMKSIYILGRLLETLSAGSEEFEIVAKDLKIKLKKFEKDYKHGIRLDLERFPGAKLIEL